MQLHSRQQNNDINCTFVARTNHSGEMPQHEPKYCPRCNALFECKAGNITECQCNGIVFDETERHYISRHYSDCLCRKCLLEIKHEMRLLSFNRKVNQIISPITKQ